MAGLRLVGGTDTEVKEPLLGSVAPQLAKPVPMPEGLTDEAALRWHILAQKLDGVSVRALIDEICECCHPDEGSIAALNRFFAIKQLLQSVGIAAMLAPDDFTDAPVCATVFDPKKLRKAFPDLKKLSANPMSLALY